MITAAMFTIALICAVYPMVFYYGFKLQGKNFKKVLGINIFSFFSLMAVMTVMMWSGVIYAAPDAAEAADAAGKALLNSSNGMGFLAAALSTGLACVGAGIAVASAASAALGAISEDPAIMGRTLIFVALAEGIALYGLVISIMILGRL